jgi:hypothetical protein
VLHSPIPYVRNEHDFLPHYPEQPSRKFIHNREYYIYAFLQDPDPAPEFMRIVARFASADALL